VNTSQMPDLKKIELTEKASARVKENYSHSVIIKKIQEIYRLEYEK